MKKRLFAIVPAFALVGCLGLFACAPEDEASEEVEQTEKSENEENFFVTVENGTVEKDVNDDSCLVVTYTFTNNSGETACFKDSIMAKAFQSEKELDLTETKDMDTDSVKKDVDSGDTITVQEAYLINDDDDVTVECTESADPDDPVLGTKKFPIE